MPRTTVLLYKEAGGAVPVKRWLEDLKRTDRRGFAKCVDRIQRLAALGHELRRPHADYLRDGIHELRARRGRVHYRILYFFHGRNVAVLTHGLKKEGKVPDRDINRAKMRKNDFESSPELHTYEENDRGETRDAVTIIDRMVGGDAELRAMIDEERAGADVAQLIHDARTRAGLTQKELAELIGTSQPTIARLEDANYEGHSLGMLRRIATALHLRLELRLVPDHEAA